MRSMSALSMLSASLLATVATSASASPMLVDAPVRDLFVPVGFDDNDEIVAVLDGELPNSCYKIASTDVQYDAATKTFTIQQKAWFHASFLCLQVITPFTTEVRLGVRPVGEYKVKVATGPSPDAPLAVKEATTTGPDDYLYASIESAIVQRDAATGTYKAELRGKLTNSCLEFEDVRVVDSGRTIEVLPITRLAERSDCATAEAPFVRTIELPRGMAPGRHLLHVRSLNGKAANTVFSVD